MAIKFLLQNATTEIVGRFIREARAAVRLKSEHSARVLDVGDLPDGAPYMVMEYLEGNDLSQLLRNKGALPVADAVLYLLHTCEAIAEAHSIGIIHRDLKPANLFVTRGPDGANTVKVLDFGIAKTLDEYLDEEDMGLTKTASLLGSPLYMSPEQLRSAREVTVQSDIWSLGAILYQLLAGAVPFDTKTFTELVMMVNIRQPVPLATFRGDVPPEFEAAALRCLEKQPSARFANVGELALAIADYGPPEARASAEKTARTLEAAGVQVQRAPGTSGFPSVRPVQKLAEEPSTAPPLLVTLSGASTQIIARPRSKRRLVIPGIAASVAIAAAAWVLGSRLSSPSPPSRTLATTLPDDPAPPSAVFASPPSPPPTASVTPEPTAIRTEAPRPEASESAVIAPPKRTAATVSTSRSMVPRATVTIKAAPAPSPPPPLPSPPSPSPGGLGIEIIK